MIFLLHSGIDASAIASQLGKPEYSYFFVLEGFRRALENLGEVVLVPEAGEEVDRIQASHRDECVFMCFAPPNHAPIGLNCPTISVFAWEFSNIPYETWNDDPRNDWRYVLRDHGRTIALSSYSARAVRDAMGEDFPVAGVPVPVWDQYESVRKLTRNRQATEERELHFDGNLLDSSNFSLELSDGKSAKNRAPDWDNEDFTLRFDYSGPDITRLSGFYAPEEWGTWSRAQTPFVELPYALSGVINVIVEGHAYHKNIGRDIAVTLGTSKATLRLGTDISKHALEFVLLEPASRISFRGLETTPPAGSEDRRTLGIGLVSLSFSRIDVPGETTASPQIGSDEKGGTTERGSPGVRHPDRDESRNKLRLSGVVYTSVFNPADGRKNWIDLVTAFCYAHRSNADATLVLKMVTNDPGSYMGTLRLLLTQLSPFDCRIVALKGFLPTEEYEKLMAATTYYVNSSHCEGLCLPLMEFLSGGIPAVSPDHTAMADYINDRVAFPVESSVEQNVWPEDSRDLFRTFRYRINWETLRDGFLESYQVATEDPGRYRQMSEAAIEEMEEYCSVASVTRKLDQFLKLPARKNEGPR
jgi:glycosyltransferase involved in cell wall biosynthesis